MLMPARGWQARKSNLYAGIEPVKVFVGVWGRCFLKRAPKVLGFDLKFLIFLLLDHYCPLKIGRVG